MFEQVDAWFLKLVAILLGGYFLWSLRQTLKDFKDEVSGLNKLIGKLFDNDLGLEKRVSKIEGRCEARHGEGFLDK